MSNLHTDLSTAENQSVKRAEQVSGLPLIGRFGFKDVDNWYLLLGLSDDDQRFVESVPLKPGEIIGRYVASTSIVGGLYPLVKINLVTRYVYSLTYAAFDEGYPEFESIGERAPWIVFGDERDTDYGDWIETKNGMLESGVLECRHIQYDSDCVWEYAYYFVGPDELDMARKR